MPAVFSRYSPARAYHPPMTLKPVVIAIALALFVAPALAADPADPACVTKDVQHAAVASCQAVPLAQAIQTIRSKNRGEVVRARLCRSPRGLVYMLTLLSRGGKVTRAAIDAANGNIVDGG